MPPADLATLYDAHATAVLALLRVWSGSEAEAKDLLQEVFVRLARSPGSAEQLAEPRAFLVTLARRAWLDVLRRRQTREQYHSRAAAETPQLFEDAPPDGAICREALEQALTTLPPEQREAVMMHVWAGLTFREIAAALEVPLHTAASRCRYGLGKLRALLQPIYNEIR